MLLIWSGKGYMVPLSAAGSTLSVMGATSALGIEITDEAISTTAVFLSATFIWKLNSWLESRPSNLTIVCDETGESAPFEIKNTFYWIPLKYWSLIFAIGGAFYGINSAYPGIFDV